MRVEGLDKVTKALQKAREKYVSPGAVHGQSVIVGYTAAYAIYVHENMQARHPVGQAKFLEQPARQMSQSEIPRLVSEAVANGAKLQQALYVAGLALRGASKLLCPVVTGNLKESVFTRKE